MSDELIAHYQALLAKHGDSSESLQHFDKTSQSKRFEVLTATMTAQEKSVLDIGCGLGHLLDYLEEQGRAPTHYMGVDIVPDFIELARKKHAHKAGVEFKTHDILQENLRHKFDHVVICGIFNNVMPDNWGFLEQTLTKSFALADVGLSFNLLSTYVDFQAPDLFYADPSRVIDFCKKSLSRKVDMNHSYLVKAGSIPYEYTIHVYR